MAKVRKRSTSLLLKILFFVVIAYLLYIFIGLQGQIAEKKREIKDLDLKISAKVAENEELSGILEAEVDTEYVEKIARELGYINSDEKVYESITD